MSHRMQRVIAAASVVVFAVVSPSCTDGDGPTGPDVMAPATIVLEVRSPTPNGVTLVWAAPGDDSAVGTAASYDLRYAMTPITDASWGSATRVTEVSSPRPAGQVDSVVLTVLDWGTTYHFAIKAVDESDNASALSNCPSATTELSADVASCLSCHGSANLTKTVTIPNKPSETVPLYVDIVAYQASTHRSVECTACHTDIVLAGGTHGPVAKFYGGWARYSSSQAVDHGQMIPAGQEDTRNYYTAAAVSCARSGCHTAHAGYSASAHSTIYKLREASVRTVAGHAVGEDYVVGNCNRCHASCATCHFESTISRKDRSSDDIANHWDEIQASGDGGVPAASALTEWAMDWTTNVRTHEFRRPDTFRESSVVCRTCHIGYAKPTTWGFYETATGVDSLRATGIKRHPQYQELHRPTSAHGDMQCAECHSQVHFYPGDHYLWAEGGDAQCTNCHAGHNTFHPTVACIGCHTAGLARDVGQTDGHSVWIDPATGQVRPVIVKYSEPITWYTHNWNAGAGTCVTRCHYQGNLVGALPLAGTSPLASGPTLAESLWMPVLRALSRSGH